MNTKIFLIFIALLCTMLITPAEAMLMIPEEAKTWYVDDSGGADFTNIRAAVNSASSGDTIFVYAGTYDGFEIPVPYLTIKGEGPDLVTVYGRIDIPMTAYYANATGTILEGMKITRAPLISSPCSDTTIRNCVFDGLSSIDLRAERITFENNVISNITGNNALCLRGAHNSIVKNNIIKNCTGSAIWLRGANITVKNNHIESNGYGFYFRDAGNENKIYLNTITGNTQLTKIKGTIPDITYWNSTTPIKYTYNGQTYTGYMGNYYSDYTGTDEDGNGIGDTPYVLPDNLGTDYYPLMQPYENYFNEKPVFTSIEVTPAAADLTTSSTRQFTAKALDQYGNPIENITFTWSSSNEAAGTVNSTGFFTAASVGETTITASAENINGTAKVTVNPPAVAAIKVSPSTASLTPGAALQFTAEAFDQDENPMSGIGFTWSNDNENIGTIDPDGLFTAKSFGTASISAANGEINGTALINATSTDLLAEAIDEGTQVQGKQGTVNITVKNAGPAATGPFSVLLLDGSTEIGRSTIDALGIGESSSVTIPWTPSSYGEANLTAVIDPEGAVADSNPSNNQFSRTVTVTPSLPDLSVSSVSFSNYPFFNNTLEVTIDNSGAKSAGAFNVTILIGEINRNVSIPELGGGNITTFTVKDIKRQVNENVLITVTVDPENSIPEADETNNEYSKSVTITATDQRYMGGRFSSGMDKVNNAVYHEGHIGVAYSLGGTYYTWFTQKGTVTYTTEDLPIPAGATIKSARLYQGCTWYGYPGFTVEFNGHESQERVAQYGDNINGQDAFDVTPYFNATGNNTAVITAGRYQRGFYGTLLIVVYEAESEPYRQIWINEGSDCLLYGNLDPYVGYSLFNNVSTTDLASARVTTFLESGDNNEQKTIFFNNQNVTITGKGGSDPAFFKYDVTGAIQNGTNELGVRGEDDNYFNFANAILEVTKVTASEANFSANPTSGDAPLAVQFTDTSTGTPSSWEWDFGDGETSTDQNPTHTYTAEGAYTVKLTVSNSLGSDSEEKTGYINVGSAVLAPVADFSSDITSGNAPLAVQFKDESANTPTSWEWDFGDGKTSNEQDPAHTYETVGTYTVKLTASNYGGSNSTTKTDYISVSSDVSAPVASFTTDSNAGNIPFTVKFTDTSTGEISSWKWDFGDGSTSTDQNPTHTYVTEGSYTVTLTVTGPGGSNTATSAEPLLVDAAITSPSYNGGIPLTTVQSGTVSGGLWSDSYPGFETSAKKTFNLPDYTEIKWARLYVDVYDGHMENNYRGSVNIGIDANGDSTYEIQKSEIFNTTYSFPGEGGTGPVWLNDHMNRVTSDYIMWYDLTDAIEGQQVNVQAATTKIDSSFDGRVKAMVLVVAYDDGDSDQVYYWVNQGHDTVNPMDDTYTGLTAFGTSTLASGWTSADLTAIYLASVDGTYAFQGTALPSGVKTGPYFGFNSWDISSLLTPGEDSDLAYNKYESNYFKIPLVLMNVKYEGSGPAAPDADFSSDLTAGTAPLTVNFTDQSTGSPSSWLWDFDNDGTVDSTEQNPSHTYTSAGNYTVSLKVANEGGSDSEVKEGYILVSAQESSDTTNPVIESVVLFPANTTAGATINISVNATDDTEVIEVTAGDVKLKNIDGVWQGSITAPALVGSYSLSINATDAAGNTANTSVPYRVVQLSGGANIAVSPRASTVEKGSTVSLNLKVKNTQNIDDTFKVRISVNGLPASYQADLAWFDWTEKTITLKAGEEVLLPVKVSVPEGTKAGRKLFRTNVKSETSSISGFDTGYLTIR